MKEPAMQSYALTDDSEDEDDEIHPPVVEWPNILSEPNYYEIGNEHEILPSHYDRYAKAIATESMKCINEKYKIAIPFRNPEANIPDNFRSAKKRLEYQRKMLITDGNGATQYIEKIKHLKEMDYIEKVDSTNGDRTNGVRYLPHLAKSQAKCRVVYDGVTHNLGTSINEHILLDPVLLNSLVNVLSRLCLDDYAITVNLQESSSDCYGLRMMT